MQSSDMPNEPEIHGNGKSKRKKTYAIEWRHKRIKMWDSWTRYKKYETEADRDKAINRLCRDESGFEYRIAD